MDPQLPASPGQPPLVVPAIGHKLQQDPQPCQSTRQSRLKHSRALAPGLRKHHKHANEQENRHLTTATSPAVPPAHSPTS